MPVVIIIITLYARVLLLLISRLTCLSPSVELVLSVLWGNIQCSNMDFSNTHLPLCSKTQTSQSLVQIQIQNVNICVKQTFMKKILHTIGNVGQVSRNEPRLFLNDSYGIFVFFINTKSWALRDSYLLHWYINWGYYETHSKIKSKFS